MTKALFESWCMPLHTGSPVNYLGVSTHLPIQRKINELVIVTENFYKSLYINIIKILGGY